MFFSKSTVQRCQACAPGHSAGMCCESWTGSAHQQAYHAEILTPWPTEAQRTHPPGLFLSQQGPPGTRRCRCSRAAQPDCVHLPLHGCWLTRAWGVQVSSLVQLYVDMEHTGRNAAFYEKFSTRHMIGQILRTPACSHELCDTSFTIRQLHVSACSFACDGGSAPSMGHHCFPYAPPPEML